jgi:Na+/melibiose symporter-like transporter
VLRIRSGIAAAVAACVLGHIGFVARSAQLRAQWSSVDAVGIVLTIVVAAAALLVGLAGALAHTRLNPRTCARVATLAAIVALVGWAVGQVDRWWYTASG